VKGFYLDRDRLLKRLKEIALEASEVFPQVEEIRIFGSIARCDHTGLSDLDIFILTDDPEQNPIERLKPYFIFFSERLDLSLDVIVATKDEIEGYQAMLKESMVLFRR